jgi:hypothetical protein
MSHSNFVVCEVDSREMIIAVKEALIKYDRLLPVDGLATRHATEQRQANSLSYLGGWIYGPGSNAVCGRGR